MPQTKISASKIIPAPVEQVYALVADYNEGHPRILPQPYFESLRVEKGGVGEGTVIQFWMRVMGRRQNFRAAISEPEPGRVLIETDLDTGNETIFTFDPQPDQASTLVTITTKMEGRQGFGGRFETWLAKRLLAPIYEKELALLAAVAAEGQGS